MIFARDLLEEFLQGKGWEVSRTSWGLEVFDPQLSSDCKIVIEKMVGDSCCYNIWCYRGLFNTHWAQIDLKEPGSLGVLGEIVSNYFGGEGV